MKLLTGREEKRRLDELEKCKFGISILKAILDMVERENTKLKKYKGAAEKYIENLEQENHHLKIDNAPQTANLYKNIYPKLAKKNGGKNG